MYRSFRLLACCSLSVVISACGGSSSVPPTGQVTPRDKMPAVEELENMRPTELPTAEDSSMSETPSDTSMDFLTGLRNGDNSSLPFAQRAVFGGVLVTAYNAALIDKGAPIGEFDELLPYVATWPRNADGSPWAQVRQDGPGAEPAVVIRGAGGLPNTALYVPVADGIDERYAWDSALMDRSPEAVAQTLNTFSGEASRAKYVAMASGILKPLSYYHVIFGEYPSSPASAYERLEFALHAASIEHLRETYSTLTFMRESSGRGVGLLLEGEDEPTLLLYHEPGRKGDATQRDLGLTESEQVRLNQMLPAWERWGGLETLPRLEQLAPITTD